MTTSDPREALARIKAHADSQADVPRLVAALEEVLDTHRPVEGIHCHLVCAHRYCVDEALDQRRWPCPTYTAIEGALNEEES